MRWESNMLLVQHNIDQMNFDEMVKLLVPKFNWPIKIGLKIITLHRSLTTYTFPHFHQPPPVRSVRGPKLGYSQVG